MTYSRGAREVRQIISGHLRTMLPRQLAIARGEWQLAEEQLPGPDAADIRTYEVSSVDRWPMVSVSVSRARQHIRRNVAMGGSEEYARRYSVRLYAWVRGEGFDETLRMRDDYEAVLWQSLLLVPSLGDPNTVLDEGTLGSDFSDASALKGDRWVAGVRMDFEVLHAEALSRVALGSAESLSVTGTVLPRHPAED